MPTTILVIFTLILLGIMGGAVGTVVTYRRIRSSQNVTLFQIRQMNKDLQVYIRETGTQQLGQTHAGRKLLNVLKETGELTAIDNNWQNSEYRKRKILEAHYSEMQARKFARVEEARIRNGSPIAIMTDTTRTIFLANEEERFIGTSDE